MGIALDTGVPPPAQAGIRSISVNNETQMAKVEVPVAMLEKVQEALPFYDRAMVGMQQEIDRISQEEQRLRSRSPVLSALSAISSHLANQPDMPGIVRGLGAANREMNPNPDQLAMQKLPLYMQVAKLAEDKAQLAMRGGELGANIQARADNRELVNWQKGEAEATKRQGQLREHIEKGTLNTTIARTLLGRNADEAEIQAYVAASEEQKALKADEAKLRAQDRTLRQQQIDNQFEIAKGNQAINKASLEIKKAVGADKAAVLEAQARNYLASAGYKETQTANYMGEYALKLAQYERGSEKMQLDAAVALAGLPWLNDQQKAEYQAKIDRLGKKFGQAPASAQPKTPAERAGTGGDRGGVVTITGPGGMPVQVRPMGDGRYLTSDRKIVKQQPNGKWVVVGQG